jgi:tungstate transport system substrate-binding protein
MLMASRLLILLVTLCVASPVVAADRLRLATTTSTENSGLLTVLLPAFESVCSCQVDVIAVGTGQALRLGSSGDVDVVMVHAPALEAAFVKDGFGLERHTFMQNDFVIVGPTADPATVRSGDDGPSALAVIRAAGAGFVSRGDDSGTHSRERQLWTKAGVEPDWSGYMSAGQGMGAVLLMASEKQAYSLTDRGTWLARKDALELVVVLEGDAALINPYSVIAVNPKRFDWVQAGLANQLVDWLKSKDAQDRIGAFRAGGEQLFVPLMLAD